MARVKKLRDISGDVVYPKTVASAVVYDEGRSVSTLMSDSLYLGEEDAPIEEIDPIDANTLQGYSSDYFASKEYLNDRINDIKEEVTPIKGVDYFDVHDKNSIISQVYDMIKNGGVVGFVDKNNNIILNGNLAEENYTIKYMMEDGSTVDIGVLIFDNNTHHSISTNLINCTIDNNETSIIQGSSYTTTIVPTNGYYISSIIVTMDGYDVTSTVVSGNTINITHVTGDIIITASAIENNIPYTNILNTYDIIYNKRWSKSTNSYVDCNGMMALEIPLEAVYNKTIYMRGFEPGLAASEEYKGAVWYIYGNDTLIGTCKSDTDVDSIIVWDCVALNTIDDTSSIIINGDSFKAVEGGDTVESGDTLYINLAISQDAITAADIEGKVITIDEPIGGFIENNNEPEVPTYTNILNTYDIIYNKRWSKSTDSYVDCNGMIAFEIPLESVYNKTIYMRGFEPGLAASEEYKGAVWYIYGNDTLIGTCKSDTDSIIVWDCVELNTIDDTSSIIINGDSFKAVEGGDTLEAGDILYINLAISQDAITEADIEGKVITIDEPIGGFIVNEEIV